MTDSDWELHELVGSILAGDAAGVSRSLAASPQLARASFRAGASRQTEKPFFLDQIKRYIYTGDTALHIASAGYQTEIVRVLLAAGTDVHARNRRGQQALHAAAVGSPGSQMWNPTAQSATIVCLIQTGADPNAIDMDGVSPLHRSVRTRSAEAVRTLLAQGADPALKNKSGSAPMVLAVHNTGRGGTGSPEAKAQQQEIIRILEQAQAAV
jgi:ankyrin repeat protein